MHVLIYKLIVLLTLVYALYKLISRCMCYYCISPFQKQAKQQLPMQPVITRSYVLYI